MGQSTFSEQSGHRLPAIARGFQNAIARIPGLRPALLIGLNAVGCLLLLIPALALAGFATAAFLIADNIQGPLDWFLIEVCASLGLVAAWTSVQLYFMRSEGVNGVPLDAHREARLFPMLERRLAHFRMRPFDAVMLTMETDLKVLTTPRWPLPLLHTRTLSVGAPLLFFISEPQFRLILAGAVSASARRRYSLTGWAQQAVQDWPLIIEIFQQHPGLASRLLSPVANLIAAGNKALGYAPEEAAMRAQTRWILDHTDEDTTRELLSCQVLARSFVDRQYWPMILKGAEQCPHPVVRPFSHFDLLLKGTFTEDAARRWLLKAQAGCGSAPRLLQNLLADLGLEFLQCPMLPERNAFERIFETTDILKKLDQHWQRTITPKWQQLHDDFQAEKARFEQLEKRSQTQELRGESAINFVRLAKKFMDQQQALTVFRKIYRANPDDASVTFTCGEAMLTAGHTLEGCDAMQRASELDSKLAHRAHALISQHKQGWLYRNPGKRELELIA